MKDRAPLATLAASAATLAAYFLVFGRFFPNRHGWLGSDFDPQVSRLLAGYYWYLENGPLGVPWFTPAFCGGIPLFADPQSLYYSSTQLLTLWLDPVRAILVTLSLCALVAFAGSYALLRSGFRASRPAAFLGATLFLFNGFFAYRMIVGHLTYHAYMVVPLAAWLCLRPLPPGKPARRLRIAVDAAGAGLVFAYIFLSGGVHIAPICGAAVLALGLLRGALPHAERGFWLRLGGAGVAALAFTAFKLVPALAYSSFFPRDHYRLPGAPDLATSAAVAFRSVFLWPAGPSDDPPFTNLQTALGVHGTEVGVTPVPLALLAIAAAVALVRRSRGGVRIRHGRGRERALHTAALVWLLLVPLLLNWYQPAWNALLKQLPFFRSSYNLMPWYALYLPSVAVAAALALDRIPAPRVRLGVCLAATAGVVALNLLRPNHWYHDQFYDPGPMVTAYREARSRGQAPPVQAISRPWRTRGPHEHLGFGVSQLPCRDPMFGYRRERFPVRSLRAGPTTAVAGGVFNLKNPACFVFPEENGCRPGDHFRVDQRPAFEAFRSYRAFPFRVPLRQRVANLVSAVSLAGAATLLAVNAWWSRRSHAGRGGPP